jgi:hypothetical protein
VIDSLKNGQKCPTLNYEKLLYHNTIFSYGGGVAELVACKPKDLEVKGSNMGTYLCFFECCLFELPADGEVSNINAEKCTSLKGTYVITPFKPMTLSMPSNDIT